MHNSYAVSYIAGEFGSAQSYKEGNSFFNSFKNNIKLSNNNYGKVYEWGIALGSMLSESNSVELAYNSRKKYTYDKYTIAIDNNSASGDQQLKFLGKIDNTTFIIFYNYDLFTYQRFTLGINTGYGWSYNKISELNEYLPNAALEASISSNNKKSNVYSFGAKINFMINDKLQLVAGYRYSNLGKFASGATYSSVDNPANNGTIQQITGNLKINEVYLRLGFYFG